MAVRKIPKNHLVVTGGYSSQKNNAMDAFESPLEKDYFHHPGLEERAEFLESQSVTPGAPKLP